MREEGKIRAAGSRGRKGKTFENKSPMIYVISLLLLLFVNGMLLLKIQMQMNSIHTTLAQVLTKLEQYQDADETRILDTKYDTLSEGPVHW